MSWIVPTTIRNPMYSGNSWWDYPMIPSTLNGQNFGMGIVEDVMREMERFERSFGYRPSVRDVQRSISQGGGGFPQELSVSGGRSHVINDKDKFAVSLDVAHFKPEEIKVKTVDNCVVIEGNHEERPDEHGFISRKFQRRYQLPKEVDAQALKSRLTADGLLTIEAPKKAIEGKGERHIPIEGVPASTTPPPGDKNKGAKK